MDYHAWIILEKSLGVLDYGNIYNSAAAHPAGRSTTAAVFNGLWKRLNALLKHERKEMEIQNAPQTEGRCHAC